MATSRDRSLSTSNFMRSVSGANDWSPQTNSTPRDMAEFNRSLMSYNPQPAEDFNTGIQVAFSPLQPPFLDPQNTTMNHDLNVRVDTALPRHPPYQQSSNSPTHPESPVGYFTSYDQGSNYPVPNPYDPYFILTPGHQHSPTESLQIPSLDHTANSSSHSGSPTSPTSPIYAPSGSGSPVLLYNSARDTNTKPLFTHRQQLQFFKDAIVLSASMNVGHMVPQQMYKPHTNSDRRRYVEEVELEAPIYFWMESPQECGIPLTDAMHARTKRMMNRDETVFEGRGPSVSIRLEWPGYRQWSRQIPTKDFRSPPGPITRAKLAKNVAKCVQRFITERKNHPLEDDADGNWKVGTDMNHIKFEDLILVSIHHVSMGSWQPHLRLRRPIN